MTANVEEQELGTQDEVRSDSNIPRLAGRIDRSAAAPALPSTLEGVYRLMTESIPHLVWRAGPDGVIDYLSEQWYAFTGVRRPQFLRAASLHEDWQSVIEDADRAGFMQRWEQAVESGTRFEAECRIHRAGNGYCWHKNRALPIRDKSGRILSWFGTSTYIDKEKREFEEMVSASLAKDRFLARLSHELRAPLTPALLLIAELQADASFPGHLRAGVEMLRDNIQREARLVDDLSDLNGDMRGKRPLHCHAVCLHAIARKVLADCQSRLTARNITLTLALGATHTIVIGDPIRLGKAIWNLLDNAIKFTPAGGHIQVGSTDTAENLLRFWVKDDGMGIPPHVMARIFAPFEQGAPSTARRFGGLGLGLAISRTIAELHQGNLYGMSDGAGQGAVFVLEVPLLPLHRIPADFESFDVAAMVEGLRGLTILLVEDQPDSALAVDRMLCGFGHEVETASTTADALACAYSRDFDLVIGDADMCDRTGQDFIRVFRQFSKTPAIALLGLEDHDGVARAHQFGFDAHLVKPVEAKVLRASIAAAIAKWAT